MLKTTLSDASHAERRFRHIRTSRKKSSAAKPRDAISEPILLAPGAQGDPWFSLIFR